VGAGVHDRGNQDGDQGVQGDNHQGDQRGSVPSEGVPHSQHHSGSSRGDSGSSGPVDQSGDSGR
jgi:hypothetical protein